MSYPFKNITISIFVVFSLSAITHQVSAADSIIKQTQTHNVFKGFLLSIWGKFKTFTPHNKQVAKAATVYTAGIRGAESTGTLIQPYWKDDLTQDTAFQKELRLYSEAITQLDNGRLKQANDTLDGFLNAFPSSALKPNALFAQSISYVGIGDKTKAEKSLNQFISDYSNHPLAEDAGALLKQLK